MPDPAMPPTTTPPSLSTQEIESGKTMAILSYIPIAMVGLIVSIISIAQKNNAYALYHAKQALTLYLVALVTSAVCGLLCFICIGIPLLMVVGVGSLVLCVMGLINASSGQCKPLPVINKFVDKWFGKIQKV